MIKYVELIKILIEWSIKSKEYSMLLFLYKNFNVGIPTKLIYKLPDINVFMSLSSFNEKNDTKKTDDKELDNLFWIFKKSKYKKLKNWNESYGYSFS